MVFIVLIAALFSLGLYGILTRKELVAILASVEIMLGAASLLFVGLATRPTLEATPGVVAGAAEAFGIILVVVAAAEAAVALAIVVVVARSVRSTSVDDIQEVSG
jgi:NADH:ubiquinone oxidoreductase subunit K